MEEILASIRRIIADDDAGKSPPKADNPMPPPPTPMAQPPRLAPPPRPVAAVPPRPPVEPVLPQDDLESMLGDAALGKPDADVLDLTESMAAEVPPPMMAEPAPFEDAPTMPGLRSEPVVEGRPLISNSTSAAVDSAFNTLAHTVLVQNARTLEDLVREMLRPLLKTWLDDNLPGMVERLVRAEIERVSRGRG
jgi:cell pole-organizing protein PopZ